MPSQQPTWTYVTITSPSEATGVHVITMNKPPENRIDVKFANEIISALRYIEKDLLGPNTSGAVILTSSSQKFWCTGVDLEEATTDPNSSAEGFFPLLATILDYTFPIIALITGHTFGGACPISLACDYRIMNKDRGFYCLPPVDLGLHFDGMGSLPRLKLQARIARKMLLQAHRWTADEAVADGVIDEAVEPSQMLTRAIQVAKAHAPRAKAGVYGLLRNELFGEATRQIQLLAHRHHRPSSLPPRANI